MTSTNAASETEANRIQRYYDPYAKDWREWNDREDRTYHRWSEEHHHNQTVRDWNKLKERERRAYWRWRHDHPEAY
jgi:hypothetical protein